MADTTNGDLDGVATVLHELTLEDETNDEKEDSENFISQWAAKEAFEIEIKDIEQYPNTTPMDVLCI